MPAYPIKAGRVDGWEFPAIAVPTRYVEALNRAGAQEAVVMPYELDAAEARDRMLDFDGLVLIGGGDVGPSAYGEEREEATRGVIGFRDHFELALARAALDTKVPILAICRGHQVLNVALAGSLEQDIAGRAGLLEHGVPGTAGGSRMHGVDVQPGSRLAAALQATQVECSSRHHQAIDRVGDGLRVVARAPDGVIEGVELDGDAWVVGVQWHPEDTAATDRTQQRLFDTFVDHAADA